MTAHADPRTPFRHGYLVRNPALYAALRVADFLAGRLARRRRHRPLPMPRRVLVAAGGHLGDAVIATTLLPLLRKALPEAQVGMLAPSWCAPVLAGHPGVARFHAVDHWFLDRSGDTLPARWLRHRRTSARALAEIRAAGYDLAIDLYPYFPNAAALLWRAGIPARVGFASGGLGPLYTTALEWTDGGRHTAERHAQLLRAALDPGAAGAGSLALAYDMPPIPPAASDRVLRLLASHGAGPREYIVMHPGSGNAAKDWPIESWRQVAAAVAAGGTRIVLTGAGAREQQQARALAAGAPVPPIDLAGRLDWDEFRAVLAHARAVVTVDTVAAHLAAAAARPVIVIMSAAGNPAHWRPLGPTATVLDGPEIAPRTVVDALGTLEGDNR